MAFKKKETDEKIDLDKPVGDQKNKEKEKAEEESKPITFEEAFVNHEKRLSHIESVLLQLRNSI